MEKELSIATIKKELMDELLNNMDILKYVASRYIKDGMKISEIYNRVIFDHDSSSAGTEYITVEVAEHQTSIVHDGKKYVVHIKIGLAEEQYLDDVASIVSGIISKLYPNRKKFTNIPFHRKEYYRYDGIHDQEYDRLNRMVSFEINN